MALPRVNNAFTIRGEGIIVAGGQAALFYSTSLLSSADAQAAGLPPASIIITPFGVQHITQDSTTGTYTPQLINNKANAFQDIAYIKDLATSDQGFNGNEWNTLGVGLNYTSTAAIAENGGELDLPAGRYWVDLIWQESAILHIADAQDNSIEYFVTPDCGQWKGYFELSAPATVVFEIYPSNDTTFSYDGIPFLEGKLEYASFAN